MIITEVEFVEKKIMDNVKSSVLKVVLLVGVVVGQQSA